MCQKATLPDGVRVLAVAVAAVACAWAQARVDGTGAPVPEWRHLGNAAVDFGLASVGTGPLSRVWYSTSGDRLYVASAAARVFATRDFEQWSAVADVPAALPASAAAATLPEPGAQVRESAAQPGRLYAFRTQAWRSDDAGAHWTNLTAVRGSSIVGSDITDLAASPQDADIVAVATATGVWRSVDGGSSWSGLNQFLPNLPPFRITGTPTGVRGLRIGLLASTRDLEWAPGEKTAWMPAADGSAMLADAQARRALSQALKATITATANSGEYLYAGSGDGRLWASSDSGRTWRNFGAPDEAGAVSAMVIDAKDPRIAIAVSGAKPAGAQRAIHVRRTMNGGLFWDDLTGNLPDAALSGVAADHGSGTVYVGGDSGVFMMTTDLSAAAGVGLWTRISEGLPQTAVSDVRLDSAGNQLYVAASGYGVYATLAPHRLRDPQVVSAADYIARAAAPGSLLTVLGAHVSQAASANAPLPILAANGTESQIQVPFEATGDTLSLNFQRGGAGQLDRTVPLQPAAPAIFVDNEGAPMVLDADSGLMLDAMHPARSRMRLQILATGLGRVTPEWPTGVAAPLENPPRVNAPVRVFIDRQPAEVSRAVLAAGYVGFYVIEVAVPAILNAGPAELYVDAGNQSSNRVRIYLEP